MKKQEFNYIIYWITAFFISIFIGIFSPHELQVFFSFTTFLLLMIYFYIIDMSKAMTKEIDHAKYRCKICKAEIIFQRKIHLLKEHGIIIPSFSGKDRKKIEAKYIEVI